MQSPIEIVIAGNAIEPTINGQKQWQLGMGGVNSPLSLMKVNGQRAT